MSRYSLSLGFFFTDVTLAERIALASAAGFEAVEFFWPHDSDFGEIAGSLEANSVSLTLFNMNEGNYAKGERGFAADPKQIDLWRRKLDHALELAKITNCPNINILTGTWIAEYSRKEQMDVLVSNLAWASPRAEAAGTRLLIEPLNVVTHPNFICTTTMQTMDIISRVRMEMATEPNIKLQFDVYQVARGEGNVVDSLRRLMPSIGHIQIADSPDRGEPGTGELNFDYILTEIDRAGYQGYIGLEYNPPTDTTNLFAWMDSINSQLTNPWLSSSQSGKEISLAKRN